MSGTYVIGIDPGLAGAIALVDLDGELHDVLDMPKMVTGKRASGTPKYQVDDQKVRDIFVNWQADDDLVCMIERVQSAPGGGATSMFTFGEGFGLVKGVMTGLDIDYHLVTPAKWKKHYDLGRDKDSSLDLARTLWPNFQEQFKLKKYDGRAEAALLALYGANDLFQS